MAAIDGNPLERAAVLRQHYLPGEDDTPESLARALWLDKTYWNNVAIAVNNGIAKAYNGGKT